MTTKSPLTEVPVNTSLLQSTKFQFSFPTLPFLRYFCQGAAIPGISTTAPVQNVPFAAVYRHGDTLQFDPLTITAIVDEDMRVWEETHNWLVALTKPQNFRQYIRSINGNETPYHDGILTMLTNANVPSLRFKFTFCHPLSISAIQVNAADSADVILTVDIVFRYDQIELERLPLIS